MIAVNDEPGCWPNRDQELLLRAALLQGGPALDAWNEWRRAVNVDVIDYGSHRMVPLLYRNMQRHGVKDPLMERLKGKVKVDVDTARRLFTLISVLHWKG